MVIQITETINPETEDVDHKITVSLPSGMVYSFYYNTKDDIIVEDKSVRKIVEKIWSGA